jgi:NAD(P)-dependent dehydrogenase (short-subunit alcohol dehydrogenase family)
MDEDAAPLAVVIGGGSGIGAALAAAHRATGVETVVWDVAGARDVTCDVADPAAVTAAVAETRARWGVPTWITVTAGVGHAGLLVDVAPEEFDRVFQVNTRGPLLCLREWARVLMAEQRPGSFVVTSSISARLVDRTMGLYCASKAALSMVVKVAAAEWGGHGLRVNAVGPGVTQTPMLGPAQPPGANPWLDAVAERTALGRLGQADDVAAVIVALHGMAWVTGQVVDCDGGLSLRSPIDAYGEAVRARRSRD